MKKKIEAIIKRLFTAVRHHPVEVVLAVLFCVMGCVYFETRHREIEVVLSYYPVLFLATYILNRLTDGKRWRFVYYLSLFFFIPFFWKAEDIGSASYLTTLVSIQLLYLVSNWERDNTRFMQKGLGYLRAILSAGLLAGVAWLLSVSIYFSIQYIFEIWETSEQRFIAYSLSLIFGGMMPLLFLMFNQDSEEQGGNKLFDMLLNYVLTPALLIYAAILYLYFIKITVLWSLPKGAVAYIVVSFVSAAFLLKGCQSFLEKRVYDWFYRFTSLASMPALAMYWVGTFYRINQYGYTEARVYLVVVGAVLTGTVLLFLNQRTGRYLYAAVWAIALLATVTYIPGITAKDIERISQLKRGNDPEVKEIPAFESYTIRDVSPLDIAGYNTLRTVRMFEEKGIGMMALTRRDTLCLYAADGTVLFKENLSQLFVRQLAKAGLSPTDSIPPRVYPQLLRIEMDSALFVFDEIGAYRYSPTVPYTISYMEPGYYLKK